MKKKVNEKNNSINSFLDANTEIKRYATDSFNCTVCNKYIKYDIKQGIKQLNRHVQSKKHLNNARLINNADVDDINNDVFNEDIAQALIVNNIPLRVLENATFKTIIEKYTKKALLSRSVYANKIIPNLYKKNYLLKTEELKNKPFYIILDETPDIKGRKIVNILAGNLIANEYSKPVLINTLEMNMVNSETLAQAILHEVSNMAVDGDFTNFKLLITDAAPYCLKLGKVLKLVISSLKHITCLVHALHNLAETIRSYCPGFNNIIASLTKIYSKSKSLRRSFSLSLNIKFPSFPVLTRWGTWLSFSKFIYLNFQSIEKYISEQTDIKFDILKEFLKEASLLDEINFLRDYFEIPIFIKRLEAQGLSVYNCIKIIKEVKEIIKDSRILNRFEEILSRNPDLQFFINFNILKCNNSDKCYDYAPLTSVDVERSFSNLKHILGDKKSKMKIETLKRHMFLFYNK